MTTDSELTCPRCGSTNVTDMRTRAKVMGISFLGAAAVSVVIALSFGWSGGWWNAALFFIGGLVALYTGKAWIQCEQCMAQSTYRPYRTKAELWGLPLVCVGSWKDAATGRKWQCKGIVAIGDIPVGIVAIGGMPFGVISIGGLGIGVFALGGLAIGLVGLGGMAIGLLLAYGGAAIGGIAIGGGAIGVVAFGGGAVGYYAAGGGAWGVHVLSYSVQDPAAVEFFQQWYPSFVERVQQYVTTGVPPG